MKLRSGRAVRNIGLVVCAAALLAAPAAQGAAGPTPTFGSTSDSFGIPNPAGVAAADLTNDGQPDLVVSSSTAGSVTVMPNTGSGGFASSGFSSYSTGSGSQPQDVTTGYLNADGNADVITPDYGTNQVSVLLGNGNGTLQTHVDYPVGTGPYGAAVANLNADSHPDIVSANRTANTISVLLGNGDGSFQGHVDYATASTPEAVAIGDLNNDGHEDIVTANDTSGGGAVSVLLGNGTGTFAPHVDYPATGGEHSVALADFNGDGKLDIAVASDAGYVSILLGKGDGTFGPATSYNTGALPRRMVVADLNNDGQPDVITAAYANSGNTISVLPGNGDGTFGGPIIVPVGHSYLDALTAADLVGDHRDDVVVGSVSESTITVLHNTTVLAQPNDLMIDQFRNDGPGGSEDGYVDLYNNRNSPIDLEGWHLVRHLGSVDAPLSLPSATLQPGHHYLVADAGGYSLSTPYDTFMGGPSAFDSGVRMTEPTGGMIDQVGFAGGASGYCEGTCLAEPSNDVAQWAWMRKFSGGRPVDTGNNASDFTFVSTDADTNGHGAGAVLGSPDPLGMASPVQRNDIAQSYLLDPTASAAIAPNRSYDSGTGTLTVRRKITNTSTNEKITALNLRITSITTFGNTSASQAPLAARSGTGDQTAGGQTEVPTTLDSVSADPPGGGLGSSLSVPLPSGGLLPGQSVYAYLLFHAAHGGAFSFGYNAEATTVKTS